MPVSDLTVAKRRFRWLSWRFRGVESGTRPDPAGSGGHRTGQDVTRTTVPPPARRQVGRLVACKGSRTANQ